MMHHPFKFLFSVALLLCASFILSGCTHQPQIVTSNTPTLTVTPATTPSSYASFTKQTLYDLMVAELAGQNDHLDIMLDYYLQQARQTKDLGIIQRTLQVSSYAKAHAISLEMAQLWLSIEPNNVEALATASNELIRQQQFTAAAQLLVQLAESNQVRDFDFVVETARTLSHEQRQLFIDQVSPLLQKKQLYAPLWLTCALLAEQNNALEIALSDAQTALLLEPEYLSAIAFEAKLLIQLKRFQQAETVLAQASQHFPKNKRLQTVYAKVLLERQQPQKALIVFDRLIQQYPNDTDLLLSLALLAWENQLLAPAKSYLHQLIDQLEIHKPDDRATTETEEETNQASQLDSAHLYLAQIAIAEHDSKMALEQYEKITDDPLFGPAQIQSALILVDLGQVDSARENLKQARQRAPEQAVDFFVVESDILTRQNQYATAESLLTTALMQYPNDQSLLYSRSVVAEKQKNWDRMEKDLRQIIKHHPDSAIALNALGYTFADQNRNLKEAYALIQKAHTLEPEDPSILDSLGWIQYRMGHYPEAKMQLEKAYQKLQDHEIAAHLGEVLWINGEKIQAIQTWQSALKKTPHSELLKETMKRFHVESTP